MCSVERVDACNAFIEALLERIERVDNPETEASTVTPPAQRPSAVTLPQPEELRLFGSNEIRWKLSVAAGFASAGFPLVAPRIAANDLVILVVVLIGTLGGLLFAVLSFMAKGRMRYVSILGAILGFIPPLFY